MDIPVNLIPFDQFRDAVKGNPKTDLGWPDVIPSYKPVFGSVATATKAMATPTYKGLIEKNGILLVGDSHDTPEGMINLCHMVDVLPVKSIYLEQRATMVIENVEFMTWLRANKAADATVTFAKMMELCLLGKRVPSQAQFFLESRRLSKMNVDQAGDAFRRWLEVEVALAKLIASRNIAVRTLFTTSGPEDQAGARKRDEGVYKDFLTEAGVRIFFGGAAHIFSGGRGIEEETPIYNLLRYTKGIFACPAQTYLHNAHYLKTFPNLQPAFFKNEEGIDLGSWKADQKVTGVSATRPGKDGTCTHQVFFKLYAWKTQ